MEIILGSVNWCYLQNYIWCVAGIFEGGFTAILNYQKQRSEGQTQPLKDFQRSMYLNSPNRFIFWVTIIQKPSLQMKLGQHGLSNWPIKSCKGILKDFCSTEFSTGYPTTWLMPSHKHNSIMTKAMDFFYLLFFMQRNISGTSNDWSMSKYQ